MASICSYFLSEGLHGPERRKASSGFVKPSSTLSPKWMPPWHIPVRSPQSYFASTRPYSLFLSKWMSLSTLTPDTIQIGLSFSLLSPVWMMPIGPFLGFANVGWWPWVFMHSFLVPPQTERPQATCLHFLLSPNLEYIEYNHSWSFHHALFSDYTKKIPLTKPQNRLSRTISFNHIRLQQSYNSLQKILFFSTPSTNIIFPAIVSSQITLILLNGCLTKTTSNDEHATSIVNPASTTKRSNHKTLRVCSF